jgi:hypothetical protein
MEIDELASGEDDAVVVVSTLPVMVMKGQGEEAVSRPMPE